jgi:hypothetical protein
VRLQPAYSTLRSVLLRTAVPREPTLLIGEPDHDTDVARVGAEATTIASTHRTRERLERAASRARMGDLLESSLVEQLEADHDFEVVTDPAQPHDAVLFVEVPRFGLENDLDATHVTSSYRVRATLRAGRSAGADGELLWRRCGRDRSPVEPPAPPAPEEPGDERVVGDGVLDLRTLRFLDAGEVEHIFARMARDMSRYVSQALAGDAQGAGP